MNMMAMTDEEEIDPLTGMPIAAGGMAGGMPNVPRNPDDPREKIRAYLEKQQRQSQLRQQPGYREMERGPSEVLRSNDQDLALMNLFQQSANQVGTIGGKTASSAPTEALTKNLMASNQGARQDIMGQRQAAQGDEDRQMKIRQYLADKMQTDEEKAYRRSIEEKNYNQRDRAIAATAAERTRAAAEKEKKAAEPTEGERKAGAFANRAESANNAYENFVKEKPEAAQLGTKDYLIGKYAGELGSGLMSQESKMTKQLEKEFIGSVLRPETGAAASDDEWAMYGAKYFPRVNDTPEMLKRKADVRKQDIGTMKQIAGKGAVPLTTQPAPTAASGTTEFPGAPAIGTVEDGMKYLGGDPSKQESWGQ